MQFLCHVYIRVLFAGTASTVPHKDTPYPMLSVPRLGKRAISSQLLGVVVATEDKAYLSARCAGILTASNTTPLILRRRFGSSLRL